MLPLVAGGRKMPEEKASTSRLSEKQGQRVVFLFGGRRRSYGQIARKKKARRRIRPQQRA